MRNRAIGFTRTLTKILICALFCFLTISCTSRSALEPQDTLKNSDVARIYIIRPNTLIGVLQSIRVSVNNKKVGNLGVGSHLYVDRLPGEYNLVIEHEYDFGKWERTVGITSKKEYYFKIVPRITNVTSTGTTSAVNGKMQIISVSEEEGKSLIEATKE